MITLNMLLWAASASAGFVLGYLVARRRYRGGRHRTLPLRRP